MRITVFPFRNEDGQKALSRIYGDGNFRARLLGLKTALTKPQHAV